MQTLWLGEGGREGGRGLNRTGKRKKQKILNKDSLMTSTKPSL